MMASNGKENIADGLVAGTSFRAPSLSPKKAALAALSPKKSSRKTRSKSIGPGGLGALEEPALKESSGNRRKSAFIPAVKSILASNDEEEKKRREARRKSLAKRRVSFAPEATLHTWDVVEYMRDATTSSASSEASRRASNVSEASAHTSSAPDSDGAEAPSTPPEQIEEHIPEPESEPANQRDLHQKKNRRSSGIPPMNFNNPEDVYSSSPLSGDNQSPARADDEDSVSDNDAPEGLDSSPNAEESSQSSARLDAALREASAQASTQNLDLDEDGDMSMDLTEDEITASFQPWANKNPAPPQNAQQGVDLFSPAGPASSSDAEEEDMSMDITRAMGRIVPQPESESPGSDDMSMDLTTAIGKIKPGASKESDNRRKSLKRRISLLETSQGSPAKRSASRRTSLRQRMISEDTSPADDATMDFTLAIGAIKSKPSTESSAEPERRTSVGTTFGDETMDFTVAVGSIKDSQGADGQADDTDSDVDEDLSMEFTKVVGGIKRLEPRTATPEKPAAIVEDTQESTKNPTPKRSPKKSPGRPRKLDMSSKAASPQKGAQHSPKKSPGRPRKSLPFTTPEKPQFQQRIEDFEPSPFVRSAPQSESKPNDTVSTPQNNISYPVLPEVPAVPADPIEAPILDRRRSSLSSVQFSPLAATREEPTLKSTTLLTNSIKLLSTPRKQTLMSPVKRGLTPKKSQTPQKEDMPKQKTPTPTPNKATPRKSLSPKKHVVFGEEPEANSEFQEENALPEDEDDVERISLQEFLDLTKIRFMDLSTTKRRHTAAPAAFHDKEIEEKEESLDRYVVAAACTLPEFELYQHACHEMKKYISDGRHFVRTMEANVMEENPLLFSEYLTAPPDQRAIMDNQFKNLKTSARLEARGEWYGWRSTLLQDLKAGLLGTMEGFLRDESVLADKEKLLDSVLPPLIEKQQRLSSERTQLQQRHDELNSCDREELETAREQLVAADAELVEKRRLLEQLQNELGEKEARIEAVKERKVECLQEIKVAERLREECRGWTTTEVNDLKAKVTSLENIHGWSIASASSSTVTMTHSNDLELYFQPSAFATGKDSPNGSISLTYIGDSAAPHPRPLTTSKRFFLQLIRAHLHCIPQSKTRIADLLSLIRTSWATALAVAEGVRWLEHNHITEECILSDERMAISSNILLPSVQTKIKVTFDIGVGLGTDGVTAEVGTKAEIIYGEKYSEDKMGAFLLDFCGKAVKDEKQMSTWADGVHDLAARLKATGRKGVRV